MNGSALRALGSDSAVYGLSAVIGQLLPMFVLTPLYGHLFAPDEFGTVALANSLLSLLALCLVLGLDNSAHRYFWNSTDPEDRQRTVGSWLQFFLVLSLLGGAVLWACRDLVVERLSLPPAMVVSLALLLPLKVLPQVWFNWYRMQRKLAPVFWLNTATAVLTVLFTLYALLVLQRGAAGVFEAQVAANLLLSLCALAGIAPLLSPRVFAAARLREMLAYAVPLFPAGLLFWLMNLADRWYLNHRFDLAQVGIYQMAATVALLVGVPVAAFQQAWGPYALSVSRREDAPRVYAGLMLRLMTVFSVFAALATLLAPEVLYLAAGQGYAPAAGWVLPLMFAQVFVVLYYVAAIGCNLAMKNQPILFALVAGALTKVALTLLLAEWLGVRGVAWATFASCLVMAVSLLLMAQRYYFVPYAYRASAAVVAAPIAVSAGATWLWPAFTPVSASVKLALLALLAMLAWRRRAGLANWFNRV